MSKQLKISINDKWWWIPPIKNIWKEELQALIDGELAFNSILEQMKLNYRLALANFQAIGKETEIYRSIKEIEKIQWFIADRIQKSKEKINKNKL